MPRFLFQAKNLQGQMQTGQLEGRDETEVRVMLKAKNLQPLRVVAQVGGAKAPDVGLFAGRASSKELQIFTRQLATLVNAGIPIVDALRVLGDGKRDPIIKAAATKVRELIVGGKRLGDAMATQPHVFDRLYVNMVRAGEEAGILDGILNRLATYMEKSEKIKKQIKGAMVLPGAILSIALVVVVGILVFIIPRFQDLYKSSKKDLPGLTQMVVDASNFLQQQWYVAIGGSVAAVFLFLTWMRSPEGQEAMDRILIRLPAVGELVQKSSVARMTRTLSTLLSSGVNIVDAIEIAGKTCGNVVIEEALMRCRQSVISGKSFAAPLGREEMIPDMVTQMIRIGEDSGSMDQMLGKIADFYEDDVENAVKAVMSLIEPVMMVFLGGIIAVLVLAMYLPIFSMASTTPGM